MKKLLFVFISLFCAVPQVIASVEIQWKVVPV